MAENSVPTADNSGAAAIAGPLPIDTGFGWHLSLAIDAQRDVVWGLQASLLMMADSMQLHGTEDRDPKVPAYQWALRNAAATLEQVATDLELSLLQVRALEMGVEQAEVAHG